ncbi:MAG: DNA polymerase III subunit delta [Bacteroidales bacterium]|nr:DNA polymerase III subunit delta [Bacteroidales bacterium]
MAKGFAETDTLCRQMVKDAVNGVFSPVYLLMGDEPYYVDMVCDAVLEHCLDESERDFNQTVCYGADVDADAVITAARRYPMFAERQLVVVKEAQMMKSLEDLSVYCQNPLESTVLVIAMHGASADKRKSLYKTVSKMGTVVDSQTLRDYEMPKWISMFYETKGMKIAPDAAALLAEYAGTNLNKIAIETEKMLKNLPENVREVSVSDIEKNVGISRQFSIFELTKELSFRNSAKALRIAAYIGSSAKFAMPMAVSGLYTHFNRILKYGALLMKAPRPMNDQKAKVLGVNPYFFSEYDTAVRNYPVNKCMSVIALLKEYDYKGKGGDVGEATPEELMVELVAKILNV